MIGFYNNPDIGDVVFTSKCFDYHVFKKDGMYYLTKYNELIDTKQVPNIVPNHQEWVNTYLLEEQLEINAMLMEKLK